MNHPRRWVFLAGKPFLPDLADPFAAGLGGTEQAVIHLTTALAAAGETVTVAGATRATRLIGGVQWLADRTAAADLTVAINDARQLPRGASSPVVWFHNEVELLKEWRRGRLPALLRARPTAVFIGTEQARAASRLLPFRQRAVIPYGLSAAVLDSAPASGLPPARAMFTSQAYRGLREVLGMWHAHVAPVLPEARLEALIAEHDVAAYRDLALNARVAIAPRVANAEVLAKLQRTRVLLAPGHVSETFCLAAAEAIALGVPVVTLGIGSLKERVRDGIDGFVCRDYAEMAARTVALLSDDALWLRMQAAAVATRAGRSWADVARRWQAVIG